MYMYLSLSLYLSISLFNYLFQLLLARKQKLLSGTRNVVQDQEVRIQLLEREIVMMKQRRQWGDSDENDDESRRRNTEDGLSYTGSSSGTSASSKTVTEMDEETRSDSSSQNV
jgi:hypothetical protein